MTKIITYEVKVFPDGSKRWYLNAELHREDGPAIEWADGSKHWFLNGKRHREDGPAVENADGQKCWYLNGTEYSTEAEWKSALNNPSCHGKIIEIDGKKYRLAEI